MLKNTETTYGSLAKWLHWLMAAIIIVLIAVGIYMAGLEDEAPGRGTLYMMHKSFGVIALLLIALRIIWVIMNPRPKLPDAFEPKEKGIITGVKHLLYLLMIVMPVSGYLMSNAGGYPIKLFGMLEMPALVEKSKAIGGFMHETHEILGWAMLLIILVHIAGVIKHRLKDKGSDKDILQRML